MHSSFGQQYINLKDRLYRQLDGYGLKNKSKENKPPNLKLTTAHSSKLFNIKERQPICKSNNLVLQICLQASIGDSETFRELILNKQAIKEHNISFRTRETLRGNSTSPNRYSQPVFAKRQRPLTSKVVKQMKKQFQPQLLTYNSTQRSRVCQEKYPGWQPPSEAIGIIAPPPLVLNNTHLKSKRRKKEQPNNKKYQALMGLNKKMVDMWSYWGLKSTRHRRIKNRISEDV